MSESVTLQLTCFKSAITRHVGNHEAYQRYAAMRAWLEVNQVKHRFYWEDTGCYYPDALILDAESAVAFRLTYSV